MLKIEEMENTIENVEHDLEDLAHEDDPVQTSIFSDKSDQDVAKYLKYCYPGGE